MKLEILNGLEQKNERGEGREDRMNTERMSGGVGKQR